MKVSSLQQFIRNFAAPIKEMGASNKVLKDLEETCEGLNTFADYDFGQLLELLRQSEEYRRTGVLPVSSNGKARTKGPKEPKEAKEPKAAFDPKPFIEKIQALDERLAEDASEAEAVAEDFAKLELSELTAPQLHEIAAGLGRPHKVKKADVLKVLVPGGPPSKPSKPVTDEVKTKAQEVRAIEERAAAPESTSEELEEELNKLDLDAMNIKDLQSVAKELGCDVKSKTTKPDTIKMIRRVVLERKESLETVDA